MKYARREARAKIDSLQRLFGQEERDMERKLARLEAQREMERRTHQDLMCLLQRRQQELADQVTGWNSKLTQKLETLDDEYCQIKEVMVQTAYVSFRLS